MTDELLATRDSRTVQLILAGEETGPAGAAALTPVPGLDLIFDRASGRLSQVIVDLPHGSRQTDGNNEFGAWHILTGLFGARAVAGLGKTGALWSTRRLSPASGVSAAFSRLAVFDAARSTSPVPVTSPLWATEAAVMALRAGLLQRARVEAAVAVTGLADLLASSPLPDALFGPAMLVAALAQADEPEAARIVREGIVDVRDGTVEGFGSSRPDWLATCRSPLAGQGAHRILAVPAAPPFMRSLRWALDLSLLPDGLILPALPPDSDLTVCPEQRDCLVIGVRLAPDADDIALSRCRARLVLPATRRVVATAPLMRQGSEARASMRIPCDLDGLDALGESWIEIVAKEDAPVRSGTLRRLRQALRWADSALRAERRPRGLAPEFGDEDWAAISATGWENCGRCWEAAGDHQRASQAFENARAPGASTQAHRQKRLGFLADEQRFLAETFGR